MERAEGLEGPAPNTVISWTPDCIRTGQRRKAVPSHPYRGLVLGKVVSWLVTVSVHSLHVECNCFYFAPISHRSKFEDGMEWTPQVWQFICTLIQEVGKETAHDSLVADDENIALTFQLHDDRLQPLYQVLV
jgi:hypothetical protein